jgi:O-antigen/teichoic acid export membrane protein
MSFVRGLARDAIASVARHIVTVIAGVVSVPILARSLGAERLGFWSFLGTTAFVLALTDLGLNTATLRAAAGTDPAHARRVARLATWVTALVGLPAAAASVPWLWSVAEKLPEENRPDAHVAILIAMCGGVINAVSQPIRSYAQGQGYLVRLAWARAAGVLVQFAVMVTGLLLGYSLRAVAAGFVVGTTLEGLLGMWAASDGVKAKGLPGREHKREIIRVAGAGMMTNLAVVFAVRMDILVLERVTNLATIGAYSVGQRIVDQGFTVVKQISAALIPRLGTRSENRGATIALGTMTMGVLAGAPLAALAVAGRELIVLWAGPAVDQPILQAALVFFSISAMLVSVETVATSGMSVGGNAVTAARYVSMGALTNVVLSLAGGFTLGPWAVAAATATGSLVVTVLVWRATRKALDWSWSQVWAALSPPLAAIMVSGACSFWLVSLGVNSIVAMSSAAAAGLGLAMVSVWRLFRKYEKAGAM